MSATQDFDTGPLNWVRGDIEAALKGAADRVRAYGTDGNLENALRLARDEAHMATGALHMVGLEGAARVSGAIEETLTGMDEKTIPVDQLNSRDILDALDALLKWTNRMADGRGEGELALFPTYRKLRNMAGSQQVFESELFFPNLKVQRRGEAPVRTVRGADFTLLVKAARTNFQRGLLAFLRGVKPEAGLAAMHKAVSDIEASISSSAVRSFWWACAGFIDALQHQGFEANLNVKQLLARIDLQMRRLMDGSPQVAERLMRDALYFVAISKALGDDSRAVKAAFALDKYLPRQHQLDAEQLARARPVLKLLKETLSAARNIWNAYSEGKQDALPEFDAAAERLFTQASALQIVTLGGLVGELRDTAAAMNSLDAHLREPAQLEIATTLLFLQNSVDSEDLLDPTFPPRAESQIRRLNAARSGRAEGSAMDLMDETAQKAAEHELFGHLGKEIGSSLRQMEEHLDAFFRDSEAREGLASLESLSAQIQGALTILDLPDATQLLQTTTDSMRPYVVAGTPSNEDKIRVAEALSSLGLFVEAYLAGRQDAQRILHPAQLAFGLAAAGSEEDEAPTVEAGLANRKATAASTYLDWQQGGGEEERKKCLAALTELGHDADLIADASLKSATAAALELLREQAQPDAALAERISALTGHDIPAPIALEMAPEESVAATTPFELSLEPTGEEAPAPVASVPEATPVPAAEPPQAAPATTEAADYSAFAALEFEHVAIEPTAAAPAAATVAEPPTSTETIEFEALEFEPAAAGEAATHVESEVPAAPVAEAAAEAPAIDPELLDIFLEEAGEVLDNLAAAADACEANADDHDNQTVIRRAFHTLKGSGRMVGLTAFGEAAWGMEQMMNGWLAAEKPASAQLLATVRKAHELFAAWVAALRENSAAWMDAAPVLAQAASVGGEEHEVPAETAAAAAETAPPAPLVEEEAIEIAVPAEPKAAAEPEPVAPEPAAPEEVCIGEVRLSPGLFEVFKAESAQWAHTLDEEAMRLATIAPAQVSTTALRGVHTLAGIAGTTGFKPLSELAHAVEVYFKRLEEHPVPHVAMPTVQGALSAISSMIRSIHELISPLPANELTAMLATLPVEEPAPLEEAIEITVPAGETLEIAAEEPLPAESGIEEISIEEIPLEAAAEPLAAPATEQATAAEMAAPAPGVEIPVFESRAVHDEIDPVMLPIFLEEADTLVPEAGQALRDWKARPASSAAPSALRRVLHTLKGSARMAGAMRLGELTHIMESRVVAVLEGQAQIDAATFDTLEHEFDRMADTVDRLKAGTPEPVVTHVETEVADADVVLPAEEVSLQQMIEEARKATAPVFEKRIVQDEIDEVLLPIFLEEADTLVPEAAQALRDWKLSPSATEAPSALRRVLHTIKGSARMAGAMRLGELTHIMESRVIAVLEGQNVADSVIFDALEQEFDRMADTVDRLKTGAPEPETAHVESDVASADIVMPAQVEVTARPEAAPAVLHAVQQPTQAAEAQQHRESATLRVRADWVDRMVNQAGEVAIARSRIESEMFALKRQVTELSDALRRLKDHLREVEIQAESQMQATFQSQARTDQFDPLEFDRFTRFQEVTRFMAESVHDVSTVQQNLSIQLGEADAALLQQSRINRELQQNLLRVRMVPLYSVSERLYRVVRQAARDANKRAQLDIQGGDLELDRGVLEKIVAPLEHLLRNSIAHGLESPEGRTAAGKPEFGEVRLTARHEGNEMVLSIKDDGAGLNLQRIREKALAQGLLSPGVEPSDSQLAQMIFMAGFTTATEVTQLAGRGVGMDVVKNEIASLGGRIEISTESGKGVTFTIFLPLTLAVSQAVMVKANKHEYALPTTLVQQVQELKPEQLAGAIQARAIDWRGNRYPLFYLPHLLGQPEATHEVLRFNAIVLMKSGTSYAGFLVDEVEGTREIVIKNIGTQLSRVTGIAGATVRGDGKVVLILNPVPLAMRALAAPAEQAQPAPTIIESALEPETVQAPMVLVVDDSLTVRKITSRLMTREGYRVETAKDGVDALEKMQDLLPDVVLLDVEMPRMDGFELARVMRNDAKLKGVPIIMITSRTADKHRNHALEIGVNVYLGKPFQEAVLLSSIADLLGERALSSTTFH